MNSGSRIAIVVLALAAVGGSFMWWRRQPPQRPAPPPVSNPVAPAAPSVVAVPAPTKPQILHPIGPATSPAGDGLPNLDESDTYFKKALDNLLGRKAVLSFLSIDGFARGLVATVNNLATDNAAAGMWPVKRTTGVIDTEARASGSVIGPGNAARYAPFVRFVEGIDTDRAVALYTGAYPLLQAAYEDLGFPGKYFNDRVVEVIDHLLATPDIAEPIKVKRIELVDASRPPGAAPLYVFEDPALEISSSGQKILLRIGRDNAAKLKTKLGDIRQRIARGPGQPGTRDRR